MSEEVSPRAGTFADLARRIDRIESRLDAQEVEFRSMSAAVARLSQNQDHATELSKLRFDALETGQRAIGAQLTSFMQRVEGLISGEVQTEQTRQGREMVDDYQRWRRDVDGDRAKVALLGRLGVLLISTNVIAIVVAIGAAVSAANK